MAQILNKRQEAILGLLERNNSLAISEILQSLSLDFKNVSRVTINRDLKDLLVSGYLKSYGQGRSTVYKLSDYYNLIRPIDIEKYFKVETDKRDIKEKFNFEIFSLLKNIFIERESVELNSLNAVYQKNIKIISDNLRKREFERLIIELSWKSSQIEGNTYSLLETEALIKRKEQVSGHKKEEAIMILNHKEALDYISKNRADYKKISVSKIEDIHYLLTKNLGITRNLRKTGVGITGTRYRPLDNNQQIKEALEKACVIVNKEKNPFSKAVILSILIAYIQPFEDGNKRTSRLTANAILLANGICPLSYRNVNETDYKKAVVLFYEQNNITFFKQLFIEQFEFAVENYFKI